MEDLFKSNNFILILGPIGNESVRSSCWYDLIHMKELGVNVSYQSFFDLSVDDQISELKKFINPNKINHIIFSLPTSFVKNLPKSLDYLRKLGRCSLSCYLLDSFERLAFLIGNTLPLSLINKMNIFDKIYSFSWHDHVKYNFTYHQTPIMYFRDVDYNTENPKYDVFFIGRRKGRVKKLKQLADYFESKNISYLFLVLRDPNADDVDYKNLRYISYIPYEDMIKTYVANCNCILSLCGRRATDPSLAYFESILYRKKLLTDAMIINCIPFTNSNNQKSFSKINEIPIEWIKSNHIDEYSMEHSNFTPLSFLRHVALDYQLFNSNFNYGNDYSLLALHYSNIGWKYQEMGEGKIYDHKLESIALINIDAKVSVHQKKYGWQSSIVSDEICGKTGESLPITAIKIHSDTSKLKYRVYISNIGWTSWASDSEVCGITNELSQNDQLLYIQGVQIIVSC
ncbi:hypothetical protein [Succinimonas amylolytica]|uniref:hypothetical protein n=1 Tax=Succinimonas amylolytica TaxID=83769 RepID=UPI0003807225|nr:hypothetical protein [Succinimonas amylolytica]